jgi:hypothetical protein
MRQKMRRMTLRLQTSVKPFVLFALNELYVAATGSTVVNKIHCTKLSE